MTTVFDALTEPRGDRAADSSTSTGAGPRRAQPLRSLSPVSSWVYC